MLHSFHSNRRVLASIFAIGIPLLALLWFKWRSIEEFDLAAERLLRLASSQLADAVAQRIHGDFERTFAVLVEEIHHDDLRRLDLGEIGAHFQSFDDDFCFVEGVFVGLVAGHRQIFFFPLTAHTDDGGITVSTPTEAVVPDLALSSLLWHQVNQAETKRRSVDCGHIDYLAMRYHVLVHLLYASSRTRTGPEVFVGFVVKHRRLWDHYFPEVVKTMGQRHRTHLSELPAIPAVSVVDDEGIELYRSGRSLQTDYEAEVRVPVRFVDIQYLDLRDQPASPVRYVDVRTGYNSGSVAALVRQHGNQQRWIWGVTAFLVISGLALTTRATYREARLVRTKLEFFSRLAHDAKTPLANIRLFADTLKGRPNLNPTKAQQYYEILSSQAQRLAHRISGILDVARIEAGVRTYPMEPVDLKHTLRCALESYSYELTQSGFRHEVTFPADDVTVMGNPDALEQLFGNLIDNAIKYSARDRFLCLRLVTEHGRARVDVTDRGIGIPQGEQQKIFRKFYRIHQSSGSPNGTGLGLATVVHVVRAHDGHISVSSAPGQGTTFTVHLPMMRERNAG